MINLLPEHLEIVRDILRRHVPGCEVYIFGSRTTNSVKKYSDLDLVIIGKEKLSGNVMHSLINDFQESDLPFRVDVMDWNTISKEFQKVIEKNHKILLNF